VEVRGLCEGGSGLSYADYLASPHWQRIRGQAAERSQGLCELCKSAAAETHHIQYPRGTAADSVDNVLHVCSTCHRRLHGMHELITDRGLAELRVETFKNRPATVWVDQRRWVWAPQEAWAAALLIPAGHRMRLFAGLSMRARTLASERNEPFELPDPKGVLWLRWAVINDSLLAWYFRMEARRQAGDKNLSEDDAFLLRNISAIRAWGDALQERALAGSVAAAHAKAPDNTAALSQAMALIAGVQQDHEVRIVAVEGKVLTLERNPDAFLDAKSFVIERGVAPDRCVPGTKLTVQQWLGMEMAKRGAEKGARVTTRLEGTARTAEVNSYRRRDLAEAFKGLPHG
jgi:hypothetical protein